VIDWLLRALVAGGLWVALVSLVDWDLRPRTALGGVFFGALWATWQMWDEIAPRLRRGPGTSADSR